MSRDILVIKAEGNLVSKPKLIEELSGDWVCSCKLATNPAGKRWDKETQEEISRAERNKTRTFILLKIRGKDAIDFHRQFTEGDRVYVEGDALTQRLPKVVWSKKEHAWAQLIVDVDEDGNNLLPIKEELLVLQVSEFTAAAHVPATRTIPT